MSVSQPYSEIQKYERVFSLYTNKTDIYVFLHAKYWVVFASNCYFWPLAPNHDFNPNFFLKWWYFLEKWKITQSYELLSSDVGMDLRHLAITLSRSVEIYPITEKNSCKSDFENIISVACKPARSLLLSGYLIQNMRFSKCEGGSRKTGIYWSF